MKKNSSIKYNVNINQLALSELSDDMDMIDAAILDYIYGICSSVNEKIELRRIKDEKGSWTWIDFQTLLEQMPLLRIKSRSSVTPRIQKIEKNGFISTFKKRIKGHVCLFVKLDREIESLFVKLDSSVRLNEQETQKPVRETGPIIKLLNTHNDIRLDNRSEEKETSKYHPDTNKLIGLFSALNKDYASLYARPNQREAIQKLMQFSAEDKIDIRQLVQMAKDCQGVQYAPQIFTPMDMVTKYSKLIAQSKKTEKPHFGTDQPYTKGKYVDEEVTVYENK